MQAVVVHSDASSVTVSLPRAIACAKCLEGRGCGMGLLARRDASTVELTLPFSGPAPVIGSQIELRWPDRSGVLIMALIGYGLPLLGLLIGAGLCAAFSLPIGLSVGLTISTLFACLVIARKMATSQQQITRCRPLVAA